MITELANKAYFSDNAVANNHLSQFYPQDGGER